MKKVLLIAALVALMASPSFALISGSKHDFSSAAWKAGDTRTCVVCHTPHNGQTAVTNAPLWNHELSASTYVLYTGGTTYNATSVQPSGVSKLCLSCHDGTVGLEAFGGVTTSTNKISTYANLNDTPASVGLSNDHPISIAYTTASATADGGLNNPSTALSGVTGSGTIATDMLFTNKLECASCHDVHNGGNGGAGFPKMLIKANTGSALCLTCHAK